MSVINRYILVAFFKKAARFELISLAPQLVQVNIRDLQQQVELQWQDTHVSCYPWWYLRGFCPCAVCQGHAAQALTFVEVENLHLTDIHEVGHYALNMVWQPTHNTGIYTFVLLRKLCPCTLCRQDQGGHHAALNLSAARQSQL